MEQLSPSATTTEPTLSGLGGAATEVPAFQSLCAATREATAMRSPRTVIREKLVQNEDPAQPKINT